MALRARYGTVALVAGLVACSEIAGLGDPPRDAVRDEDDAAADHVAPNPGATSDGGSDAPLEAAADAPLESAADARPEAAADADAGPNLPGPFASCQAAHLAVPLQPSGVFAISAADGGALPTYCEMSLDHGGWTAFYVGPVGTENVFAHFDRTAGVAVDDCVDPAVRCLRHLPESVTTTTEFAAICETDALGFTAPPALVDYFKTGTPHSWVNVPDTRALAGSPHFEWAHYFWAGGVTSDGGSDGNLGWIFTLDADGGAGVETFASAYNSGGAWAYCNGINYNGSSGASPPKQYLLYR